MLQNIIFPVRIPEGNIPEFHVSLQGLPVLPLRMKRIPVALHHLRRIRHIGLLRQKSGQPLYVDLDRRKRRDRLDNILHRFQHLKRIGHEDRQSPDPHQAIPGEHAALAQDECQYDGRHHGDRRQEQRGKMRFPDRCSLHIERFCVEVVCHLPFHAQDLDRPRPGDAFVVIARDPGIDLTDDPVVLQQLSLKEDHRRDRKRHQQQDVSRQADIDDYHHDQNADQVGTAPDEVHHSPGDQFSDQARVRHDTGMDVSDRILVIVGK